MDYQPLQEEIEMDAFIGEIILFAGNFAPRAWADCDGSVLAIDQYQALFSLLGTQYGGDGRTNFALPKLEPLAGSEGNCRYIICLEGMYPPRN
jgi:microcystin-dependent protein